MGEHAAAGMYEEPGRSLFYRKSLGLRRFYENCRRPERAKIARRRNGEGMLEK